ncbi:MAG TPA: hypothetical protein VKE26_06760 [Xanthobacteraceae bacterium]|nr:hypothetical protein [Xanthobacteraceae bacterium]
MKRISEARATSDIFCGGPRHAGGPLHFAGERCGHHAVAAHLAKVNAMKREFLRLAAERQT